MALHFVQYLLCVYKIRSRPRSTLFPYTTLFRSGLRATIRERGDVPRHGLDNAASTAVRCACGELSEPLEREQVFRVVHRFRDAVRVEQGNVAGCERDLGIGEGGFLEDAEGGTTCGRKGFHFAAGAQEERRIVSAVAVLEAAGLEIQHAQEDGDEHHRLILAAEFVVHEGQHLGGREVL